MGKPLQKMVADIGGMVALHRGLEKTFVEKKINITQLSMGKPLQLMVPDIGGMVALLGARKAFWCNTATNNGTRHRWHDCRLALGA